MTGTLIYRATDCTYTTLDICPLRCYLVTKRYYNDPKCIEVKHAICHAHVVFHGLAPFSRLCSDPWIIAPNHCALSTAGD